MGLVLAFDSTPRQASRQPAKRREPAQSADILFFTGVRYERHDAAQAPQPTRSSQSSTLVPPVQ